MMGKRPLFLFTMFCAVVSGFASTRTVGPGGGYDYTTISAAVSASSDNDTISVYGGTLTEDAIIVSKNLTITGQGAMTTTVQAAAAAGIADDLVFQINSGKTVVIKDMTIRYGKDDFTDGGGIHNDGTLELRDCVLNDNESVAANIGGGIHNDGTLNVLRCEISGNLSSHPGDEGEGGGISNYGTATISNSVVKDNSAVNRGGGIFSSGDLTVTSCEISGNTVSAGAFYGGGVHLSGLDKTARIINSTIDGNAAGSTSGKGGGIYILKGDDALDVELVNCTISANTAGGGGKGLYAYHSGGTLNLTVNNSILDNGGSDNYGSSGTVNLTRTYTVCRDASMAITGTGNQNSTDPKINSLADNGGATKTRALAGDSPCVNAIPYDGGNYNGCPAVDQRGRNRPAPPASFSGDSLKRDIGAYEFGARWEVVAGDNGGIGTYDLVPPGANDKVKYQSGAWTIAYDGAGQWRINDGASDQYTVSSSADFPPEYGWTGNGVTPARGFRGRSTVEGSSLTNHPPMVKLGDGGF